MTQDKVQILIVGLIVFAGSVFALVRDGFTLFISYWALLGLAGIVIGGWPIWSKLFKKN